MGLLGRVRDWVATKAVSGGASRYFGSTAAGTNPAGSSFDPMLPAYVAGGGPGGWASNHFEESRLVTGWHFCAVRAIARTMARATPIAYLTGERARRHVDRAAKAYRKGLLPWDALQRLKASATASAAGDDAVPLPPTHGLNRIFRRPNPWQSKSQFLFQFSQQLSVTGTALLWVRRNGYREFDDRGVPVQMFVIPTGLTVPIPPSVQFPVGAYRVMPLGAFGGGRVTEQAWFNGDGGGDQMWSNLMMTGGVIDGREVVPVRWPHPLFLTDGLSAAAAGELWIDIASQLDRATWYGFKNTLRPGIIFGMDAEAEEPNKAESDRFDKEISARSAGVDNIGRHLRLPKGLRIEDTDRSVHELDYVNGRKEVGSNVLALHATPPVATGIQESGAYSAYIASLVQFSDQAIEPQCVLLGDTGNQHIAPAYGDDIEFRVEAPPINDKEAKERVLSLDVQAQARTYNEYRKERGLKPWPDHIGGMPVGADVTHLWARELGVDPADVGGEAAPPEKPAAKAPAGGEPPSPRSSQVATSNPVAAGKPAAGSQFGPARVPNRRADRKPTATESRKSAAVRRSFEVPLYCKVYGPLPVPSLNGNGKPRKGV